MIVCGSMDILLHNGIFEQFYLPTKSRFKICKYKFGVYNYSDKSEVVKGHYCNWSTVTIEWLE